MNGIDRITERISRDVRAEIGEIQAQAEAEAAKIRAGYQAQAEKLSAELNAKGEKEALQRQERLVSVANLEARKTALAAKQEMLDQAFAQALEQLCAMPEAERAAFVRGLHSFCRLLEERLRESKAI